ncbi:hypothetical protein [Kouleothrix sp.]|uniref:hypothetical protein n=1 Tax=Kouleothrix sp. TaxID=2779161 RepID=UPI00391A3E0F
MRRTLLPIAMLAAALLLLGIAARAVFAPDPRDDLRRADALFLAGRYHDARAAYAALTARWPRFAPGWLRLGVVSALRAEPAAADTALLAAVGAGAAPADLALARLYPGALAARAGQAGQAREFWAQVSAPARLLAARRLLEAEQLLAEGQYAAAEASYRFRRRPATCRPAGGWPPPRAFLALLRASSGPGCGARAAWRARRTPAADNPADAWLEPLRPPGDAANSQLRAALDAPPEQRAQLLGQVYLAARLYPLAEAQFAQVPPGGAYARAAAAYTAYTRWSAGDRAEGLRQLQALAEAAPDDPRARALLALALLSEQDADAARAQLEALQALAPRAADTQLAWAQWHTAEHDYVAAAAAYAQALRDAAPDQRGGYALALARFHVESALDLCGAGVAGATSASQALPNDPRAWVVLAAAQLGCGDAGAARAAAEQALRLAPADAEAAYYLGRALAQLGDRPAARAALIRAADSAPASAWRVRAEQQIDLLGP